MESTQDLGRVFAGLSAVMVGMLDTTKRPDTPTRVPFDLLAPIFLPGTQSPEAMRKTQLKTNSPERERSQLKTQIPGIRNATIYR